MNAWEANVIMQQHCLRFQKRYVDLIWECLLVKCLFCLAHMQICAGSVTSNTSPVVNTDCYVPLRHNASHQFPVSFHALPTISWLLGLKDWASKHGFWWQSICSIDTGRDFTSTLPVLRCQPLQFIAHGCRLLFSQQAPFVLFQYQLTEKKTLSGKLLGYTTRTAVFYVFLSKWIWV